MYNGYDGQPPFRPPPMNLPPFPPNLGPGGQPGPGSPYPPFPPPNGFARPPFAPNLPSAPQQSPMGYNNGSPLPIRPMPGQGQMQMPYNNSPMRPPHPGLGLPPTPNNLPIPPHRQPGSNFIKAAKTTTVFVGSIAPGIDNSTISELLNACGPLYDLKRVVGAGGKLQAFGFAQFESPEVVMRCIRCLHGVELPDMTPEGRRERKPAKPLVVKVDDKTREFLDEFEATVGRTEDDETADADARKLVAQIVARIIDPHAPTPDQPTRRSGGQSPITVIVPAHLQDLREGDLPENQRVAVLDQISLFRENAARKERLKKALEEEQELARLQAPTAYKKPPNPQEYGYGTRVFSKTTPYQAPPSRGDQNQNQNQNQGVQSGPVRHDPQGYGRPVDFVKAQTAEAKAQSGRTDEEEEQLRQMKLARDREGILRDRERQVEHRERLRLENLNRELTHRRQQSEMEQRSYRNVSERLDQFDDDEVAERGKEWFYSDRNRWRNARQQQRTREYQDDVRDRQAEQDEIRAIERESEEFLKRQLEEMTRMEEEQKQRGLLTEDAAPIKLDLNTKPATAAPVPAAKIDSKPQPKARPAIAFEADDEEEVAADKRKQRTFVKLDYDEKAVAKMTEAEKVAMRNAQLLDIKSQISKDRRTLWGVNLDWKAINEKTTKAKVLGFVNSKLVEYLGEVDQDLADFIMENIAERKRPDAMVEGLEPVLAEDAVTLVIQLWRLLAFETAAAKAGLQSGNMLV